MDVTVDGRNITRGFQRQDDLDQDGRGERCCNGDEEVGDPVSFGKWRVTLQADVITAMRFPLMGIPVFSNVTSASCALEMEGAAMYWLPEDGDGQPLVVEIRLEYAAASDILRFMPHMVTSRAVTAASINWNVPAQDAHKVVRTPDLAPLVQEVQKVHGWSEVAPLT
jgi:hypothetical protein